MRRDSAESAEMRSRRMGRVFSIDSDSGRSDLITPRGSVSAQGAAATSSMYSTTGTLLETYPHGGRPSLGTMPEEAEVDPLDKSRPISTESKLSVSTRSSNGVAFSTPLSEFPPGFPTNGPESESGYPTPQTPNSDTSTTYTNGSLPPTPLSEGYNAFASSLSLSTDNESVSVTADVGETSVTDRLAHKRVKTIEELISTERSFLQDMLLTRDVWLARAGGAELAEIMTTLRSEFWTQNALVSQDSSTGSSTRTSRLASLASTSSSARPSIDLGRLSENALPSAAMARGGSQTSYMSMKGFSNPFNTSEKTPAHSRLSRSAGAFTAQEARKPDSATNSLRLGTGKLRASISAASNPFDRGQPINHGSGLSAPMSPSDIKAIFSNLADVVDFTQRFLEDLEACHEPIEGVEDPTGGSYGQAFLENVCCHRGAPICICTTDAFVFTGSAIGTGLLHLLF